MNYTQTIEQLSKELNLPSEVVDKAYKSFWRFIRDKIQELPLKEAINEDEFSLLKTNFNIPSLGKLTCTYDRMVRVKKRFKYIKEIREKHD
jgi:hypothetical protein